MKKTKFLLILLMLIAMISCEKEKDEFKLESVNDLIGNWSGDGASVNVELIDNNAYIEEINISYSTEGYSTTFIAYGYGTNECLVENYEFYYQGVSGEFLSKKELNITYNGHCFTLTK